MAVSDTEELEGSSWWAPLDAFTTENTGGVGSELRD